MTAASCFTAREFPARATLAATRGWRPWSRLGCSLGLGLLALPAFSQVQEQVFTDGGPGQSVTKFWGTAAPGLAPEEWRARWIWRRGETQGTNLLLLARKRFMLEARPERARLYLTADNFYELHVNGVLVNRGPARCQPHQQSYDILEIAPLLREGENVLAVRALHQGTYGSFNLPPRPGLLAQLEIQTGATRQLIVTDASFKVAGAAGVELDSEHYAERVDFRKTEHGWTQPGFDDSGWANAAELLSDRFLGWPGPSPHSRPQTLTSPWKTLVPRDIPYLKESLVKATTLFEKGEILELGFSNPVTEGLHGLLFPSERTTVSGLAEYPQGLGPLVTRNSYPTRVFADDAIYSTYLIFDLGEILHGYPRLEIEGPAGTIVDLVYEPALLRGKFPLRPNLHGRPGRRPTAERLILRNGVNHWEALELKYARYLFLAIRNTDRPVKLSFAGMRRVDYPFQPHGAFSVRGDDPLNWLWQAGKNTLDVVTTDAFTDNYRERLQYAQTSYYAARCSYAAYGDSHLQRRLLRQIALEQQSDGILPAAAPVFEHKGQRFLDASIFWLLGLHDYGLYSGDIATVRELLPAAGKILDRFRTWENREGFIDTPPYTYWIDHAAIDRYGASLALNALHLLALDAGREMCGWLGEIDQARQYGQRAQQLRQRLQEAFWDPEEKLFSDVRLDGKRSRTFSEQSNSLAIVAGLATPGQQREIVRALVAPQSRRLVPAVLFMHYVVEALFLAGEGEAALALLKDRYRHMQEAGSQTLWEDWGQTVTFRTGRFEPIGHVTVSQAENTYVSASLSKWLLGIRPTQPGLREVVLMPNLCGLQEIAGRLPSPHGSLGVRWKRTGTGWRLEAEIPAGVRGLLDLSAIPAGTKTLHLDGRPAEAAPTPHHYVPVPTGKHLLELR
jgi:alpha-L-rhamnosidase